MRYFQPAILARIRSLDDDVSEAASEEWRQAADAYLRRFGEIRRWMPVGVRKLRSRFSLHDAKVVGIAADEDGPRLTLLLQIGPTAGRPAVALGLAYHLVAGPAGGCPRHRHPEIAEANEATWVLYDEFDMDGERSHFIHRLLLTDGTELEMRFHSLNVFRLGGEVRPLKDAEQPRPNELAKA